MIIGAVVLAAGASLRLGRPKQLIVFRGQTLVRRSVEAALGARYRPVVVVLGANSDRILPELAYLPVAVTQNENWEGGMGSSIRAGLEKLFALDPALDAVLIMACDQPLISSEDLGNLARTHAERHATITACRYGGSLGVPAVFSRDRFEELQTIGAGSGAKRIIAAHSQNVAEMALETASFDVDTEDDVGKLAKEKG